jgi:hypothetical protein
MNTSKPLLNTPLIVSILLGRFSVWLGSVVAPIYLALFILTRTQAATRPELAGMTLPVLLPEVGLCLGMTGIFFAFLGRRPTPNVCLFGLALNAISMALAVSLRLMPAGG